MRVGMELPAWPGTSQVLPKGHGPMLEFGAGPRIEIQEEVVKRYGVKS